MTTSEDLYNWMVEQFQSDFSSSGRDSGGYGFDVYIPNLVAKYLKFQGFDQEQSRWHSAQASQVAPKFLDTCWEMCRRGILRPSWAGADDQNLVGPGYGYSFTTEGRQWLLSSTSGHLLASTGRMGELFIQYRSQFGEGYFERSQEAVKAFNARAFLACCAMCGAAAESILLATAIEKEKDEKKVMSMYLAARGRANIENLLFGSKSNHIRSEVASGLDILKHWRDAAAHGSATNITETEANVALLLLLKFAEVTKSRWTELVN